MNRHRQLSLIKFRVLPPMLGAVFFAINAAANVVVSNTNDSGAGSFRQAIADAPSGDTITFAPALAGQTITLTSVSDTTYGPSALYVNKSLTVIGLTGASGVTITRGSGAPEMRLLRAGASALLTIRNVTVSNGFARGTTGQSADAGGGGGGGGLGGAILNEGTLYLDSCALTGNTAVGGIGGNGGLTGSGNFGGGNGGGPNGGAGAQTYPGYGGNGGFGGGGGGGDNSAGFFDGSYGGAGGIGGGGGGGGDTQGGPGGRGGFAPITGVRAGDNRGGGGGGLGLGGAIFNKAGFLNLTNCTVSGNVTGGGAGGVSQSGGGTGASGAGFGGGICNYNGQATFTNVTIAGNSGFGGGIYNLGDGANGQVTLINCILSNLPSDDYGQQAFNSGTNQTLGRNNLIRNNGGYGGGIVSTGDPLLGVLQNNGGPTATRALPLNSPAIDAGDDNGIPAAFDQRGSTRKSRAHVDLGAYELQNLLPTANAQSISANQNATRVITFSGTDPENDSLTYSVVTNPAHGTLTSANGAQITYTPTTGYAGSDSFTFKATDAYGGASGAATVSITVNAAPVASAQSVTTNQDTAKIITLAATDAEGDAITYSLVSNPTHGSLGTITGNQITYAPAAGYFGSDSFTFRAVDAKGAVSNTATVTITVNGAPIAVNQSIGVVQGGTRAITLAANDPEAQEVTFTIVSGPTQGALGTLSGNQISYIAPVNYVGPDSFTYRATDSQGAVGPVATVSVNVISRLIVTTTADTVVNDEFVSLREAISYANAVAGADTITFNLPAGPRLINLASTLTINSDVTIDGPADGAVTVRCPRTGSSFFLIFDIQSGTVTLSRLTIADGLGSQAGGINNAGNLTVSNCTISGSSGNGIRSSSTLTVIDSTLTNNNATFGAAIQNTGKLDILRSLFSSNTAQGSGGAISNFGSAPVTITDTTFDNNQASGGGGGALENWSTTTLRNCTFNNNRSPGFEGGAVGNYTNGVLSVANCTFTGNLSKNRGGAIYNSSVSVLTLKSSTLTSNTVSDTAQSWAGGSGLYDLGTLTIQNTVIAGNTAANRGDVITSGTSLGYNFIGKWDSGIIFTAAGDQYGTSATPLDAKLDTLKNNGGPTFTAAPLPNSPLIDKGKRSTDAASNPINTDQRGFVRPVDLSGLANAVGGDGSDIGAVELPASLFPTANDQSVTTAEDTAKTITLTGAITDGSTLTFEIVTQPTHGSLGAIAGNQVTYTPAANYNGADSFTFRVLSSTGAPSSNVGTVTLTITAVPDAPVASNQSVNAGYGSPTTITLGATDADGDALTFAIVAGPTHGSLGNISGNQITYTPANGYSGPDSFTFKTNDGALDSNTATVSITVNEAPSLFVTTALDGMNAADGLTTLREAIAYASTLSGNPTITFASYISGIFPSSTLVINHDMTITGPGANLLQISGSGSIRVLSIASGKMVNLSGLTIANGRTSGQSGAGISSAGTLTVTACTFSGNVVTGIADAGAIHNNGGTLVVSASTFTQNSAAYGGGGIRNESGTSTLTNCTFAGNAAGFSGGAVQLINGSMSLRFCTLTNNTAPGNSGGGVQNQNGNPLHVTECIISGNSGGDTSGALSDDGFNLIGGNAKLDSGLKDNGGPTQTIALLYDSPAVNAGDPFIIAPPAFDQRGAGYPRQFGPRVDIGAFERQVANNVPVASDQSVSTPQNTAKTITLTASDADGNPLTYAVIIPPQHGSVGAVTGNTVTYTPATGYVGPDSFRFNANDGVDGSNLATVSITVTEVPSLVVTTTDDTSANDGLTSLREAIAFATTQSSSPTITFAVSGTITLSSELALAHDMTINGPGAGTLTLNGNNATRVFNVSAGTAMIANLKIANGKSSYGAGVKVAGAKVTLTGCVLDGNVASTSGAGIFSEGTLTLNDCTVSNNKAEPYGAYSGGLGVATGTATVNRCTFFGNTGTEGGAILNGATLTVSNSTLSGNTSYGGAGAGVYNTPTGTLTVSNSTIAFNTGTNTGAGIFNYQTGVTTIGNSIVAGNTAQHGPDISGTTTSNDYNLFGSAPEGTMSGTTAHNIITANAKLDVLKNNGGSTLTIALLHGSAAIDAGDPLFASPPDYDQRGANFPRKFGPRIDIGAFEAQVANAAPVAGADAIQRYLNGSASVAEATLLSNDTDPEGDTPLTIVSVSGSASGQGTISRANGYIFYDPAPGFTGSDSFLYQVSDSLGAISLGTVSVNVNSANPPVNSPLITMEAANGGGTQARVVFTALAGRTYSIQFTDSLTIPPMNWQTLTTATAGPDGQFQIVEPAPLPPKRFYRAVYP